MKNILSLLFIATMLLVACNQVEQIQSLSQLEPALRKYVGNPSKIDTVYKYEYKTYSSILYLFEDSSNVSFQRVVDFLSKAYDCEPQLTLEEKRHLAKFESDSESNPYSTGVLEYYKERDNKRILYIIAIDKNNELVTPSSQTPQTVAPSK